MRLSFRHWLQIQWYRHDDVGAVAALAMGLARTGLWKQENSNSLRTALFFNQKLTPIVAAQFKVAVEEYLDYYNHNKCKPCYRYSFIDLGGYSYYEDGDPQNYVSDTQLNEGDIIDLNGAGYRVMRLTMTLNAGVYSTFSGYMQAID